MDHPEGAGETGSVLIDMCSWNFIAPRSVLTVECCSFGNRTTRCPAREWRRTRSGCNSMRLPAISASSCRVLIYLMK